MSVLYVTQPGAEVRKDGGRFKIVGPGGNVLAAVPIREVERVALLAPAQVSAAAARTLLQAGVPVIFGNSYGKYYGTLSPGSENVERWLAQVRCWQNEDYRLAVARAIVGVKVRHQRSLLRRQARNHPDPLLGQAADQLTRLLNTLEERTTIPQVMGSKDRGRPSISACWDAVSGRKESPSPSATAARPATR